MPGRIRVDVRVFYLGNPNVANFEATVNHNLMLTQKSSHNSGENGRDIVFIVSFRLRISKIL
jgi:hypothetical protein